MQLKPNDILKADISCICYLLEKYRPIKYQQYRYDTINSTKKIAIYYQPKKVIIGFRGTVITSVRDLHSDAFIMLNKMNQNKYFKEAETAFMNIISVYSNHKIELTGHSLGGSIALYLNSLPYLENMIYKNTIFNPGITQAPIQKHIIETYAENKKNRFIIKKGDPISNNIIKFKPKNIILLEEPDSKNPLQNHSLSLFTSDKMKKYITKLIQNDGTNKTKTKTNTNTHKTKKNIIKERFIKKKEDFDIWTQLKLSKFT